VLGGCKGQVAQRSRVTDNDTKTKEGLRPSRHLSVSITYNYFFFVYNVVSLLLARRRFGVRWWSPPPL
jgi:hypothetical protein